VERVQRRVERAVRDAVERHALWPAGATFVAAVSGGADSLCLLGALLALRDQGSASVAPGALVVAHLDHGLRGEAGAADVAWVRSFCEGLGLRCIVERADVRAVASAERRSIEDAARCVRYTFLRRVAADVGAERICTGHTLDDQAETVALHWLRGAGLEGLAGMAPLEDDVARPLLTVSRADTEAYCAARGWQPRHDETNADPRFLRNRVRRELLPTLESYNPQIRRTLARNADLIRADEAYLEDQVDAVWKRCVVERRPDALVLSRRGVTEAPAALRRRVLRRACWELASRERGPEAVHILTVDEALQRPSSGERIALPGGIELHISYDTVELRHGPTHKAAAAWDTTERPLPVPGSVELPELSWRLRAWRSELPPGLDSGGQPAAAELPPFAQAGTHAEVGHAETRVYLDAAAAGGPLSVRTWRPGDRFQPMGMSQSKKLQDFFADAKVPRELRHRVPLVVGPEGILWVGGLRPDERARVTEATRSVLVLQLDPLDSA
jgi:tRNA(Ile)-lysidine synthase